MALTKRQSEILGVIKHFIAANGYSPSFSEIGAAAGLRSLATVHKHVTNLRRKRLLATEFNHSRSIQVAGVCPTCGSKTKAGK